MTYRLYKPRNEWSVIFTDTFTGCLSRVLTESEAIHAVQSWGDKLAKTENEYYLEYKMSIN